ncbi:hypothetical protein ACOSP7_010389 [Xanthoceras sorbifolium]
MNLQVLAAMIEAGECDDETNEVSVDPSIQKGNQDLDYVCGIVLAVSNGL